MKPQFGQNQSSLSNEVVESHGIFKASLINKKWRQQPAVAAALTKSRVNRLLHATIRRFVDRMGRRSSNSNISSASSSENNKLNDCSNSSTSTSMRLQYQRPAFEVAGIGIYFFGIISLLAVSFCGSAFYLLRLSAIEQSSTPSTVLEQTETFIEFVRNSTSLDEEVQTGLEKMIGEQLCTDNMSCRFEQRHLPPFVQSLRPGVVDKLRQLRKSTVLVVTFNRRSTYYVAPLVHVLYRRIFADIFYCGPSLNVSNFQRGISQYFTDEKIIDYFGQQYLAYQSPEPHIDGFGENNYYCFNLALNRLQATRPNFDPSGVFVLADDAIFSYWNLAFDDEALKLQWSYSLPYPKLVYDTETLNACDIGSEPSNCNTPNPWINWPENYRTPTSNFYHELVELATSSSDPVYVQCLQRISSRTKGVFRVMTGYADMFYVARQHFREALAMFDLASRNKVFQEIAVPTSFACFDTQTTGFIDDSADNTNSLDDDRKSPWEAYDSKRILMHPFKFSNVVRALFGDKDIRRSRMLGICLYCLLAQYSKLLSVLIIATL